MAEHETGNQLGKVKKTLAALRGSWRFILIWPAAACIFAIVGWAFLMHDLNREKQEADNEAHLQTESLAKSYADHLTRTVAAIDQVILHVKFEWELSKGKLQLENVRERGLFPSSSLFYVAIIDRNDATVTSNMPHANRIHVPDRNYFLTQKNEVQDFLYIGRSVGGDTANKNVIHFSRKLVDREGRFNGVVLVSVPPEYFTTDYDNRSLGKNGFLGVASNDGSVLLTRTGSAARSLEARTLVPSTQFSSSYGSVLLDGEHWFSDGRSRYVGWQYVHGYPLAAISGLDAHSLLARQQQSRDAAIRTAIFVTIALVLLKSIAMLLSIRLALRKHQLETTQATYRMATEEGNEGFYIAQPISDRSGVVTDFEITDCNRRGASLVRQRREDLIGKKVGALYGGVQLARAMGRLCQAMEVGYCEEEVQMRGDEVGTTRWVHLKIVRSNGVLAITLRDISDAKAHVEALERRSNEDALTGLPNRHWVQTYLPQAIERAASTNAKLALLFVDLDGFKAVNDTMGHPAGDAVLRLAAQRLKVAVRPHDQVVRLGGDEFVVIIEKIEHETDAAHVAQRVLDAFKERFALTEGVHAIGTSIGISVFPWDGKDADTLLQAADIAMYSVKTSGKGSYRFYEPTFYEALRARLEQEQELRRAMESDQFTIYYQSRVDVATGATTSMEALVRWQHPSRGMLEACDFIPLAEETGLIIGIGELVIDKVCAQLALWAKNGRPLVPVSVNVSPRQFNEIDIAKVFSEALTRHDIDPQLLEIELTESSMMGYGDAVSMALRNIQTMGIKLLVDDFGTGYSSLAQLQRLDFDVLKVDRAFTSVVEKTKEGKVFFTAIITMAHALGMRVVAEGVENEAQLTILRALECDEMQGFFLSHPVPAGAMQPVLPRWSFSSAA